MKHTREVAKLLATLWLLAAPAAHAAGFGQALLVADDRPNGGPGCAQTAQALAGRLQQLGLTVHSVVNPSAAGLRDVLDAFADATAIATADSPAGTNLIYICAPATAEQSRLFIMPSAEGVASPPATTQDPQTQGVVLQALANALAGTGGTLYADLRVAADPAGQLVPPDGLHLALNLDARSHPHLLGTVLSASGFPLDGDWTKIVAALGSTGDGLVMAPAPVPTPAPVEPPTPPSSVPQPPPSPPATTPAPVAAAVSASPPQHSRANEPTAKTEGRPAALPRPAYTASKARTARIEAALARRGVYAGPIDGKHSQAVAEAVRSFQQQLGDPATGTLTAVQIIRLLNS